MMRVDDWDTALHGVLDEWADRQFEYGEADCARFVAATVQALTGQDFYAPFLGRYSSAMGAARAMTRIGDTDLPGTITAALGAPVHPALAGRGDVVMIDGNAGICMGVRSLFVGDAGLEERLTAAATLAWKV